MSITLKGAALRSEATRLNIPGRSRMTADELRTAIAATVSDPVPNPQDATETPSTPFAPRTTPTPFRARNGKRKPSAVRRNRRK